MKATFEVDKQGLAKLLERRGKQFAVLELFQNAVDEQGVTQVDLTLFPGPKGTYELVVKDDSPEGFSDLRFAYTLFAESAKKLNPKQRGRFNLGEKLVIAICEFAEIRTTKGTIQFTETGRQESDLHTERGSIFRGVIRMSQDEAVEAEAAIRTVIVPEGIEATFNGDPLDHRQPVRSFEVTLRTEIADDEGYLRPTNRKTTVAVYEAEPGMAQLYELGIPVVDTEDRWSVDIGQKVPLNTDRDNVPPGYLRDVRVAVLNNCADLLGDDATGKWVDDALEDDAVEHEAVAAVIKGRYGDKAVIDDRTDPEGTKMAMAQGYTVVPGGAFSKEAWKHVRQSESILPAGKVTPSPNPNEGADELELLDPEHWPEHVRVIADYAKALAGPLLGVDLSVRVTGDMSWPYLATYGGRTLTLNFGRLGYAFFKGGRTEKVDALLLHEFAHEKVSDHLSHEFHSECCRLAAKMVQLALDEPSLFAQFAGSSNEVAA